MWLSYSVSTHVVHPICTIRFFGHPVDWWGGEPLVLFGLFEVSESRNFPHSAQTETCLDTIQYFLPTSEVPGELEGRPEPAPEQSRRLVRWETTRVGQLFEMLVVQEKTCEWIILSDVRTT